MRSRSSEPSSTDRARQYALKLLAARDYTSAGLRQKLRAKGFDEENLDSAVSRLENEGWISDRRFAERFAESAMASGRFYGGRLKLEMRRRGLDEDLTCEVIGRVTEGYDEDDEVRALIEKRYPGFSPSATDDREKRRMLGFLQRRGFGFSAIMRAIKSGPNE